MKVLFIGNDASLTGAPIGLLHLLRWLKANADVEFELMLRVGGGPLTEAYCELAGVVAYSDLTCDRGPIRRLARRAGFRNLAGASCLSPGERIYSSRGFDLIYANTITNGGILSDLAALGCPVLCHVHELESVIARYGRRNMAHVRKRTRCFMADSLATRDNLVRRHAVRRDRVEVVHECIPVADTVNQGGGGSEVRARLGIPPGALVVGGSGSPYWRKGKDLFVRLAAKVVRAASPPAAFVWVGGDENDEDGRRLRRDIETAGLGGVVHVVPHVSRPAEYYAAFDVFALTSREEPLGMVMLEAACFAVPSLCFAGSGGAPEFVGDDAGCVVPHFDVDAMAEKVRLLARNAELRRRLGAGAAAKVRRRHDVGIVAPRILETIRRTALGKRLA